MFARSRHGAPALIRRLLMEHAYRHRYGYAVAFILMAGAAAATALSAYLLGDVINQAYVHRNFRALLLIGARRVRASSPSRAC